MSLFRRETACTFTGKWEAMDGLGLGDRGQVHAGARSSHLVCAWVDGVMSFAGHEAHRYLPLEAHCGRIKRVMG